MNHRRLERSLELLRKVNAWRLRRATLPQHTGREHLNAAFVEAQLEQHDSDCRAGLRPEQRTIFDAIAENATK